jgi:hypothetical protein
MTSASPPDQPRTDSPPASGQAHADAQPASTRQGAASPASEPAARRSAGAAGNGRLAARGARVLFQIPFRSAMTDADLERLVHSLDLSTHVEQKLRPSPTTVGVARLDNLSGLFLERGEADAQWLLEARTWGHPAPETVHAWHLLAAGAARELDPTVQMPDSPRSAPAAADRTADEDQPVGWVLKRRLARLRRRLAGVP